MGGGGLRNYRFRKLIRVRNALGGLDCRGLPTLADEQVGGAGDVEVNRSVGPAYRKSLTGNVGMGESEGVESVRHLLTVLVGSCPFLIHSPVFPVMDPRTLFLTVLVGSFEQ